LLTFQFTIIQILFKSKNNLVLETIKLRQQLMIYQTKKEDSKNITDLLTRSLLVALKRIWPKWMDALIIVKPETVIDWQRRRFKKYWTKKSAKRKRLGRPSILIMPEEKPFISMLLKHPTADYASPVGIIPAVRLKRRVR